MSTTTEEKHYPPWSNGTQFMDWQSRNCFRCQHYENGEDDTNCPVRETMEAALIDSRPWTEADDKAVGYPREDRADGKFAYTWDCPSRLLEGEEFPGASEDCEGQLRIELACTTQTLLAEIGDRHFKPEDIALTYRLAMLSSEATDWAAVNAAIIKRWSKTMLVRIKNAAHKPPADSAEALAAEQQARDDAEHDARIAELVEEWAAEMATEELP